MENYKELEIGRVWNNGHLTHTEDFNGTTITIPPKAYVEMDFKEAVLFKSQFFNLVKNAATGTEVQNKPLSVEKILVRVPKTDIAHSKDMTTLFRCMACKKPKDFPTEAEYNEHVLEQHMHALVDKKAKEELQKK